MAIGDTDVDQKSNNSPASNLPESGPAGYLAHEYENWQALLSVQPVLVQRFMEAQARKLADGLVQHAPQLRFTLPDRVVAEAGGGDALPVPSKAREQVTGGLLDRLTRAEPAALLRKRLAELESSTERGMAVSAGLVRHTTAIYMVHTLLPAGRSVTYEAAEGEEIPSIPLESWSEAPSAITASTDAIVEGESMAEEGVGELLVPYVPAARRFYLPQWVAFDEQDRLLVGTSEEAEAHLASMQRYLGILHDAVALAAYMVADDDYQRKRYGILGQLVNQGRALARFQTQQIIEAIKRRADAQDLNRGLSLSLPFFDDQTMRLKIHKIEIIPAGRIMFVPGFVVRAARQEQVKVAQDTRLSPSTRRHLLGELHILEKSF